MPNSEEMNWKEQYLKLQERVERLEAVIDIQNLMGHYEALNVPRTIEQVVPAVFATWMPDISMEVAGMGVFAGQEGVNYIFNVLLNPRNGPLLDDGEPDLRGALFLHHINTPMIQIADDGKTAHGVWYSSGIETPLDEQTHLRKAKWCWGKYAADFIKGDCGWRIWHLHWYRDFMHDYYQSWVDAYERAPESSRFVGKMDFVEPTTYHAPYSPDREPLPVPCFPAPYESHTDSMWQLGDWVKK